MRNVLTLTLVSVVFVVAYFMNQSFFTTNKVVEASTHNNVSGWAWSENIGWISTNSNDCDTDRNGFVDNISIGYCGGDNITTPALKYGLRVDTTSGDFSGDAWSGLGPSPCDADGNNKSDGGTGCPVLGTSMGLVANVGWISFDRLETGNPPSAPFNGGSGPIAKYNKNTGKVTGWARALVGCEVTLGVPVTSCVLAGVGAGTAAGGWDGWIKLAKDPSDAGASFGVTISNDLFDGYGWSDSDTTGSKKVGIGWLYFAPRIQGVFVGVRLDSVPDDAPVCTIDDAIFDGPCQAFAQCSTDGFKMGICPTPPNATFMKLCSDAPYVCPPPPPGGTCGDGKCVLPETLLTCPIDCKGPVKQF